MGSLTLTDLKPDRFPFWDAALLDVQSLCLKKFAQMPWVTLLLDSIRGELRYRQLCQNPNSGFEYNPKVATLFPDLATVDGFLHEFIFTIRAEFSTQRLKAFNDLVKTLTADNISNVYLHFRGDITSGRSLPSAPEFAEKIMHQPEVFTQYSLQEVLTLLRYAEIYRLGSSLATRQTMEIVQTKPFTEL